MIRKLFRREKPKPAVPEHELARRLIDPDYACPSTGKVLNAPSALWPEAPFGWKNPPEPEDDSVYDMGGTVIFTHNYARRDGESLVRAYLPIPVKGTEGSVYLGVWCSLRTGMHARFRNAQSRGDAQNLGEMSSFLYTQLPRFTGPLLSEGVLLPHPDGRVPFYRITTPKHPYFAAQQEGMSASDILDIYDSFGFNDVVARLRA